MIHQLNLYTTMVSGVSLEGRPKYLKRMKSLDPITLHTEPDNEFDPCAIKVINKAGKHIGYIPKHLASDMAEKIADGWNFNCWCKAILGGTPDKPSLGCCLYIAESSPDTPLKWATSRINESIDDDWKEYQYRLPSKKQAISQTKLRGGWFSALKNMFGF